MGKYYQIRKFDTSHPESHDGVVTESELKRRLEVFSDEVFIKYEGFDEIIDILLHGEKATS